MQPEIGYVEMIQAEQVLAAMQQMGWQPGTKPPGYAAIQTTLRRLYGNGGDGNRMRDLREAAIRLATGQPVDVEQEWADLPPLPEEIQQELQAMAVGFEKQLTRLDKHLAQRLDSALSEISADARAKIDTIKRESGESLAAANEELDQALTDLQAAAATINSLQAELAATREATAKAAGRLEVLEQELAAKSARISDLESRLTDTTTAMATATGRADVLEQELAAARAQVKKGAKP